MPAASDPAAALVAGAALSATAFALVPAAVVLARRVVPERHLFFARWGFSHALAALAAAVVVHLTLGLAPLEGLVWAMVRSLLVLAAAAAVALRAAARLQPEGVRALGLHPGVHARAALLGVGAYALLLPCLVGLERLGVPLLGALGVEAAEPSLLDRVLALDGAALWAAVAIAVVAAPLLEELVFRGFLQPLLVQNFGERGGVAVTSVVFAVLHPLDALLPLLGLAGLLGALQVRTQRLTAPLVVHALHNALVLLLAFHVPDARELLH